MTAINPLPEVKRVQPHDAEAALRTALATRQPLVISGLVRDWPIVRMGLTSPEALAQYLKARDGGQPVSMLEAPPEANGKFFYTPDFKGFNFSRTSLPIPDAIDRILSLIDHTDPPAVYIQSLPLPRFLPGLAEENRLDLLPANIEPRLWLGNASRTQTHNDENHNIACAIAGRRRFILFPPEQVKNLYMGPVDFTPAGSPVSLADLDAADFDRFPRLKEALESALVADLEPGDALFIPIYWWHHVQTTGRFNALINYWWGGAPANLQHPMAAFMAGLLALKDLHPRDRAYWQEMFSHFIFQEDGNPVAHIPEQAQGPLGPPKREPYRVLVARLRAHLDATQI